MKNLFFGLAVAIIALSASAFTNVKGDSLRSGVIYYQTVEGTYIVKPAGNPAHLCEYTSLNPCLVTLEGSPSETTFTAADIPNLIATYGGSTSGSNKRSVF